MEVAQPDEASRLVRSDMERAWSSRIADRFPDPADMKTLLQGFREFASSDHNEGKPWRINILIGACPRGSVLLDPGLSTLPTADQITLANLGRFGHYFTRLEDEETILCFSDNGTFRGRLVSRDIRESMAMQTEAQRQLFGATIFGPYPRRVSYYVDGRCEFLDRPLCDGWSLVSLREVASLLLDETAGSNRPGLESYKHAFKVAEAASELLIRGKGCIVFVATEADIDDTKLLKSIVELQPCRGQSLDEISLPQLVRLLGSDEAVILSPSGHLLCSGATIAHESDGTRRTARDGSRHRAYETLLVHGYPAVMVSQSGEVPLVPSAGSHQGPRHAVAGESTEEAADRAYVSPYFHHNELTFVASGRNVSLELMRFIHKARLPMRRRGTVLEIGCGLCRVLEHFAPMYDRIVGIDVSERMVRKSRVRLGYLLNAEIDVCAGDGTIPLPNETVDFVYCFGVLGFVQSPTVIRYVSESFRVLQPGGLLVLQLPNYDQPLGLLRGCDPTMRKERLRLLLHGRLGAPTPESKLGLPRRAHWIKSVLSGAGFADIAVRRPGIDRIYYLAGAMKPQA
jgi:SAM-dependent methyltransferase